MSTTAMLIAGFGGQGILFTGKFLAYKGPGRGKRSKLASFLRTGNAWRYG